MDAKIGREIKILKLFRHPHIIRLYEVIETPTEIFLVMEYVDGGELFDYIVSRGRLQDSEARKFFQQIISGVEYCHRFMVVHRDLKPENLLLDSDKHVKIADFGLSNMMHDGSFLKTSCGSPNYAAPEVITGKLYAGPEVDVWSCGVILYALLCGKLPFDEETIPTLFKKIKECSYTIPGHVSDLAKDLIQRILVVDPLKRATIKDIRNHPWFQTNLPEYLAIPPAINPNNKQRVETIDEEVLQEALQAVPDYEFDRSEAERVIKQGVMNNITVAYFLILDHKMKRVMREQYKHQELNATHRVSGSTVNASLLSSSPITATTTSSSHAYGTSPGGWPHMAQSPPSHQISLELFLDREGKVVDTDKVSPRDHESRSPRVDDLLIDVTDQRNDKNKYHLGILTTNRTSATETMREVYRVLKLMGMKWKVIGPFSLKCKYDVSPHSPHTQITSHDQFHPAVPVIGDGLRGRNEDVIMVLQVYKRPEGGYLLDLCRTAGNIFHFHDTCQEFYDHFVR